LGVLNLESPPREYAFGDGRPNSCWKLLRRPSLRSPFKTRSSLLLSAISVCVCKIRSAFVELGSSVEEGQLTIGRRLLPICHSSKRLMNRSLISKPVTADSEVIIRRYDETNRELAKFAVIKTSRIVSRRDTTASTSEHYTHTCSAERKTKFIPNTERPPNRNRRVLDLHLTIPSMHCLITPIVFLQKSYYGT